VRQETMFQYGKEEQEWNDQATCEKDT